MTNDYLYSSTHETILDLNIAENSTYIYGYSAEERSHLVDNLTTRGVAGTNFINILEIDREKIQDTNTGAEYFLRSAVSIKNLLLSNSSQNLYIDVTGVGNRVCASLIKNAIECCTNDPLLSVTVVYAEPSSYDIKKFKAESVFNDLSEKIEGIEPLPGFATIFPEDDEDILLIALLGFEGGRFTHMLENVQPSKENIVPVIGIPGFRIEYPYVAYWGNKRPLENSETWRKIRYASANSMVEIYMLLTKILNEGTNIKIKIAPIGTKPHAIGAILFAIKHPKVVELVYDNPKRKIRRTRGVGNIIECKVSKLIKEN